MLLGLSVRSHEGLHVLPYGSTSALRLPMTGPFRRRTAQGERPAAGSFGGATDSRPWSGGGGESVTWGRTLNLETRSSDGLTGSAAFRRIRDRLRPEPGR
ncbi:hypothetical protein GCM10022284_05910 [Streptomyces hundungensis]